MRLICSLFLSFMALAGAALAFDDADRTVNRSVWGAIIRPDHLINLPWHHEFLPRNSNTDLQAQHPGAQAGQDWDVKAWTAPGWTGSAALQKLFRGRVFERQFMKRGKTPAVTLGPAFYTLSDLDRSRALRLLADETRVFQQGYAVIDLVDWSTRDSVGVYTQRGLMLN